MHAMYNNNAELEGVSYDNIHSCTCDGCQSSQLYSDRYKCLQCTDYDLCGNCFEDRRQTKGHSSGHAMIHFKLPKELFGQSVSNSNEITLDKLNEMFRKKQHGMDCKGCKKPIVGTRFKCDTCYDYNLCLQCMENRVTSKNHQTNHPLVVASDKNLLKIDISDIRKGNALGKGGFGQVCKATWLSKKRLVACKTIRVTPAELHLEESFRQELATYAELSGAYILKTLGYGEHMIDHDTKECYIISEFMERGSLADVIRDPTEKISLRRKISLACHVISAMHKLHTHSIVHRDIRPDNILVSKNFTAKIGDMGIAHVFNPSKRQALMGCIPFMPPEFHAGSGEYDQSLDVFTFGLTLNELFTGKFHHFSPSTKRIRLTKQSPIFSDLIARCMNDERTLRPTAAELKHKLCKFRRAFDKYIEEKHSNYSSQSLTAKNNILITFYNEHKAEDSAPEARPMFTPPPPPLKENQNLVLQLFAGMLKEIRQADVANAHQEKGGNNHPDTNQWDKYLEDEDSDDLPVPFNVDINKKDESPSVFHQVIDKGKHHVINIVKHKS